MALQKNLWQIECNHTPETIDRVLLPIRKRGISVSKMSYEQKDAVNAVCTVEFEVDAADVERVFKNMIRLHDIQNVIRLS